MSLHDNESGKVFELKSAYKPSGDQPQAIERLVDSINSNNKFQTLLGVTGSGKTFTMANIIKETRRPTLVIAHNKTLAAVTFPEKHFFVLFMHLAEFFGGILELFILKKFFYKI